MSESNGNSNGNGKVGKLSPIQREMLRTLSDGRDHWVEELHGKLSDELGPSTNVHAHLTAIRKYLHLEGKFALVTHKYGRGSTCYSLVPLSVVLPAQAAKEI